MKIIITVVSAALLAGCGLQYIGKPLPERHERWTKSGLSHTEIKQALIDCRYDDTTTIEHLYSVDECMLEKGFQFIDPVRGSSQCSRPVAQQLPSCQSLKR